jgi:hypothetical protein
MRQECFICSVLSSSSNQRHVVLQHWEQQGYKTSSLTTLTHIFSVTDDALCNPSSGIWKHFHYTSFGGGMTTRNQIQMDLMILLLQMTNVFIFQTASSYRANCLATAFTDLTQIRRTESCPSRGGLGILSVSSSWTQKRIRCHPICTYTSKRDKGVPCACVPCHEECGEVEAEIYILQMSGLNTRARLSSVLEDWVHEEAGWAPKPAWPRHDRNSCPWRHSARTDHFTSCQITEVRKCVTAHCKSLSYTTITSDSWLTHRMATTLRARHSATSYKEWHPYCTTDVV